MSGSAHSPSARHGMTGGSLAFVKATVLQIPHHALGTVCISGSSHNGISA